MSSVKSRAWMVMAAVEGMKDHGFARWNYPLRSLHQHMKNNVRSYSQAKKLSGSSSSVISNKIRDEKLKQSEESLRKVIGKVEKLTMVEGSNELPSSNSIAVQAMNFAYPGQPPLFADFNLNVALGSRCLLVGANGSSKTSLLKILAGKHMVGGRDVVQVPDGQRRRVQICMGLLHPLKVLLLDEVIIDLDVVARMDLLDFLKEECEKRGSTIVYATHIFDGLETWATHLAYIQDGELKRTEKLPEHHELKKAKTKKKKSANTIIHPKKSSAFDMSPFRSSKHMAYNR
ncbi:hypothetical protein Cgig2_026255 [Carnegiea gigantea]|uniref:ABC transporter domain-containing protein n=1 Tax=Carnegiea gigantea TaxID=171969 RepID=A0A9Q1KHJ5_9CARY|nr:hypothetical protein Cgig2_026255 [Carnegiea gigantea]